jgi:hypothetical protein
MNKNEKISKYVRFADDDTYQYITINMSEFTPTKEFDDEVFGWYGNTYMAIKKTEKETKNEIH